VGNAIWFTPVIRQLHRAGARRIVVVARGNAIADVFRAMPEVTHTHVTGHGKRGFIDFIRHARRERADCYLVPYPSNRWHYSVLGRFSAARQVVMHHYPAGRFRAMHALAAREVEPVPGIHDVVQNLRLLAHLGIEPDYTEAPRFDVSPEMRAGAAALHHASGLTGRFVVLHAGSGATVFGAQKRWPVEKFARVADHIVQRHDLSVAVVEGPDEPGIAAEVMRHVTHPARTRPVLLRGALGVSAALCEMAELYVGNDSAIGHLAAGVGRSAVAIFAPTDPVTCAPWGSQAYVVQLRKPCAPCFTYPFQTPYPSVRCRAPYCVAEVEVAAVVESVDRALSDAGVDRVRCGSVNR
jgi:heptosyltransferase III